MGQSPFWRRWRVWLSIWRRSTRIWYMVSVGNGWIHICVLLLFLNVYMHIYICLSLYTVCQSLSFKKFHLCFLCTGFFHIPLCLLFLLNFHLLAIISFLSICAFQHSISFLSSFQCVTQSWGTMEKCMYLKTSYPCIGNILSL